jgi:shikimate kinase
MAPPEGRPARPGKQVVALVGLRCSGKSSVGRELARLRKLCFVDLDDEVAFLAGTEGARGAGAVIEELGLGAFRRLEARALERVLTTGEPAVLATGGGVVEQALNRQWLALHTRCVWLRAGTEVLRARLRADPTPRPSLTGADPALELDVLARRRGPLYAEVAELTLDVGEAAPRALAQRLAALLWPRTTRRPTVEAPGAGD